MEREIPTTQGPVGPQSSFTPILHGQIPELMAWEGTTMHSSLNYGVVVPEDEGHPGKVALDTPVRVLWTGLT